MKSFIAPIAIPGGVGLAFFPTVKQKLAALALAMATNANFSEDPLTDVREVGGVFSRVIWVPVLWPNPTFGPFTTTVPVVIPVILQKGYRLRSEGVFRFCCDDNTLLRATLRKTADVGREGPLPGEGAHFFWQSFARVNASRASFSWGFSGRPNILAEPAFQAVAFRTSRYIWHYIAGSISCKGGKGFYSIATFTGSAFPPATGSGSMAHCGLLRFGRDHLVVCGYPQSAGPTMSLEILMLAVRRATRARRPGPDLQRQRRRRTCHSHRSCGWTATFPSQLTVASGRTRAGTSGASRAACGGRGWPD